MKDIFISYSRKDQYKVLQYVSELEIRGFSVWIDKDGIYSGDKFKSVITQAIEDSRVLIFFSSQFSNMSPWTAKEIGVAHYFNKPIIPIKLDTSRYNQEVLFDLVNIDYIDTTNNDFISCYSKLLVSIENLIYGSTSKSFVKPKNNVNNISKRSNGDSLLNTSSNNRISTPKAVILGDKSVGKTSVVADLVYLFNHKNINVGTYNSFSHNGRNIKGLKETINIDGQIIDLYDIDSSENIDNVIKTLAPDIAIIVTSADGIRIHIEDYIRFAKNHNIRNVVPYINKCDLQPDIQIIELIEMELGITIDKYDFTNKETYIRCCALGSRNGVDSWVNKSREFAKFLKSFC